MEQRNVSSPQFFMPYAVRLITGHVGLKARAVNVIRDFDDIPFYAVVIRFPDCE